MTRSAYFDRRKLILLLAVLLFLAFGAYLFVRSLPYQDFSEERYIYDLIWLDAWGLSFFVVVVIIWSACRSRSVKAMGILGAFSVFGWVAVGLFLSGTPFGPNGYSGDQLFRLAMILKFAELGSIWDFYYKDLTPFYPPVYYWLLSVGSRVMSLEPFEMIKYGNMGIYLFAPLLMYWIWRQLLAPLQALLATLFNFLLLSFEYPYIYSVPHAFLANSFFIPWWIHYVEQVRVKKAGWVHYLIGGVIGGLLFMTYYFPFFIGGLLLLLRLVISRFGSSMSPSEDFRWSRAVVVLVSAAVFSAPFWLPLFWTMVTMGSDAAQQSWHHAGVTGIRLRFMDLSVPGLLYLASVLYAAKRNRNPIYRVFLMFIGAVILFLLAGSVLGALGKPVNLIKSREFAAVLGGPLVGLSLASLFRLRGRGRRQIWWPRVLVGVILLFCLNGFISYAKQSVVKNARTTQVPDWGISEGTKVCWKGSVVLSGHNALYSFHPVYAFLFTNHHYSNPAALFSDRFEFLRHLQYVPDAYSFYIALKHNRFDAVDYFMPGGRGDDMNIRIHLSNYPNRYDTRDLKYPHTLIQDSSLFIPEQGDNLYRLANHAATSSDHFDFSAYTERDSLLILMRARELGPYLSEAGRARLSAYFGAEFTRWRSHISETDAPKFGNAIELSAVESIVVGDSLHLIVKFRSIRETSRNLRVFAHLYYGDTLGVFQNFDFPLTQPSSLWKKGETTLHHQALSLSARSAWLHLGLFDNQGRLDNGTWLDLSL